MRAERQAARRAAEAAKRSSATPIVASMGRGARGRGRRRVSTRGSDDPADPASPPARRRPGRAATDGPVHRTRPARPRPPVTPPPATPEVSGGLTATMKTNRGTVAFTLDADSALRQPELRDARGAGLLRRHAVPPADRGRPSVLQCGDPSGTGTGGPGYSFAEENLKGATYPRGHRRDGQELGAGVDGSQFFLVYGDSGLPPEYTVVGKITKGLDVLDKIAKGGVGEADENGNTPPKTSVQIEDLSTAPA